MNWRDIPGYEGLYQVSDCGKIKSLERPHHLRGIRKEKILILSVDRGGYQFIKLWKNGSSKQLYIHRLVMYSHSHVDEELTVNHIDGNKLNNHISNLEYMTNGDNTRYYHKNNPTCVVLDTFTNITFTSVSSASRYMFESKEATGPWVWYHKIKNNKQDRFITIH
jgi:hypothetical protein